MFCMLTNFSSKLGKIEDNLNPISFDFMLNRDEIPALCVSNPEVIVYIVSLETQIKDLTERLISLESCINQNSCNNSCPFNGLFFVKEKNKPRSLCKKSSKEWQEA